MYYSLEYLLGGAYW